MGEVIRPYAQDQRKNSHLEVLWSGRRDLDRFPDVSSFELNLSRVYKNVASIELLGLRVPVCQEVTDRGSFYLFVWADNRPLDLVSLGFTTSHDLTPAERDSFSLDGAFSHVFVSGDPTILHPYKHYRRIFRFHTPLTKLTKLRIELRMYPADPKNKSWVLVPMLHDNDCVDNGFGCTGCKCDEIEMLFEVNAQI